MDSRIGPEMAPIDGSYPETPPFNHPEGGEAYGTPCSPRNVTPMDDPDQEDPAEPGDAAQEERGNKLELTGVEKAFVIGVCLVAATALVMAIWDFSGL